LQPPSRERKKERKKKKKLYRLRKGNAQNAKPSYTGDKLLEPTPIEWTGLQFNDRKRAKATKTPVFLLISSRWVRPEKNTIKTS
jgi:hypothetical protein